MSVACRRAGWTPARGSDARLRPHVRLLACTHSRARSCGAFTTTREGRDLQAYLRPVGDAERWGIAPLEDGIVA